MLIGSAMLLCSRCSQRGFTYLGLMFLIVFIGIGLAMAGTVWQTEMQREREKELLFIGEQYTQAIGSYHDSTLGGLRQYPTRIEDLLLDNRFPVVRRHLRKLYRDPITGGEEWGLIKQQGRISGIYSLSKAKPLKRVGFPDKFADFAKAENYQDWQFNVLGGVVGSDELSATAIPAVGFPPPTSAGAAQPADAAAPVAPPSPAADNRPEYSVCQGKLEADTAQCRATCGNLAGQQCLNCFAAAFDRYRLCLRGG
jgi:type II secretory pathway pseudopilin PulG